MGLAAQGRPRNAWRMRARGMLEHKPCDSSFCLTRGQRSSDRSVPRCPTGAGKAVHYTLGQWPKLIRYLSLLFAQLPYARTVEDFEALLPWNVKTTLPLIS